MFSFNRKVFTQIDNPLTYFRLCWFFVCFIYIMEDEIRWMGPEMMLSHLLVLTHLTNIMLLIWVLFIDHHHHHISSSSSFGPYISTSWGRLHKSYISYSIRFKALSSVHLHIIKWFLVVFTKFSLAFSFFHIAIAFCMWSLLKSVFSLPISGKVFHHVLLNWY